MITTNALQIQQIAKKWSVFEQLILNQLNSADLRQAGISLMLTLEGLLRPFRAELIAEGMSLDEFSAYRVGKNP